MRTASNAEVIDSQFGSLPELLPRNSHLIWNESRVFAARVYAIPISKPSNVSNKKVEVLFLNPEHPHTDPSLALVAPSHGQVWRCMVRKEYHQPGAWRYVFECDGDCVQKMSFSTFFFVDLSLGGVGLGGSLALGPIGLASHESVVLEIEHIHSIWDEEDEDNGVEANVKVVVNSSSSLSSSPSLEPTNLAALLTQHGEVPLPPYLRRPAQQSDTTDYQNVFASSSVAGPPPPPLPPFFLTSPRASDTSFLPTIYSIVAHRRNAHCRFRCCPHGGSSFHTGAAPTAR